MVENRLKKMVDLRMKSNPAYTAEQVKHLEDDINEFTGRMRMQETILKQLSAPAQPVSKTDEQAYQKLVREYERRKKNCEIHIMHCADEIIQLQQKIKDLRAGAAFSAQAAGVEDKLLLNIFELCDAIKKALEGHYVSQTRRVSTVRKGHSRKI